MFFGLDLEELQLYWWGILSLLGGLLVFMFFVQGGQGLIFTLPKDEEEKTLLINSLGRKWELGFTNLVMFGGAAFAAFPLFYSVSFGGAYWVWLCILFCYILQAVSYEYRKKEGNFLGTRTYEIFLWINGILAPLLIGIALSTFFSGAEFILKEGNFVEWKGAARGLEALLNPYNYLLGIALIFLSRILALGYFLNHIDEESLYSKIKKGSLIYGILFLIFFLAFLTWIFLKEGFILKGKMVEIVSNIYLLNFFNLPFFAILFILGVILVIAGIMLLCKLYKKAIFILGLGSVLAVFSLLSTLGFGNKVFYPSVINLEDSLHIFNASSSYYTLSVMGYVSLLTPFVLGYIAYVWKAMDRVKLTKKELENNHHIY
ncbi:cytochrome C oxidase assembly protein [Helicobacter valdiviensis]|uniref:Cytochrome C oxidase assembly protein n=1 Tax=Helicobacter valdiviensis TaxID=1458358 RepID=A0A2W6NJ98_9HELI|nr:cytochrome d ubiquinol oxidase subunit II [Helicobacter valdiviensis]PZT48990.1 cytochrome C oxidase assembly protein [Helicobacter valdiviensis]